MAPFWRARVWPASVEQRPEPGAPAGGVLVDVLSNEGKNLKMEFSANGVRATAGSLRGAEGVRLAHAWTDGGVVAAPVTNGAQVLHLSVALCVLNDTYREAQRLGIEIEGVAVEADGGFDDDWHSTGIGYSVTLDTRASGEDLERLNAVVDAVAEIPRAIRAGAAVVRRT